MAAIGKGFSWCKRNFWNRCTSLRLLSARAGRMPVRMAIIAAGLIIAAVFLLKIGFSSSQLEVVQLSEAPQLVIYNRVPRCASLFTVVLFQELNFKRRRFDQYMSNIFATQDLEPHLQEQLVMKLSDVVNTTQVPVLYDRHFYFIDFEEYATANPVYINLIRDPIEQFASTFYASHPQNVSGAQVPAMTLEECVDTKCPEFVDPFHVFIAYFCGTQPECFNRGQAAVTQSKRNLEKRFLLVGVQEHLPEFYWALEKLLPSYFEGLHALWISKSMDPANVAPRNRNFPNETVAVMKKHFQIEYDFYGFVLQRFNAIHGALKERTLSYRPFEPVSSRAFEAQKHKAGKEAIVKRYGRVGEFQCDTCIFMTDGF